MKTSNFVLLVFALCFCSVSVGQQPPKSAKRVESAILGAHYLEAGSLSSQEQNEKLNSAVMSVKSNDPRANAIALNVELKAQGLPQLDIESPNFKMEPTRSTGSTGSKIVGAKFTDGNVTACVPCEVGTNSYRWGVMGVATNSSAPVAVTAPRAGDAKYDFRCDGQDYVAIERSLAEGKVRTAICPKNLANDFDACVADNSERSEKVCLPLWKAQIKADCKGMQHEQFECSIAVNLHGGGSDKRFEAMTCPLSKKGYFCPSYTFSAAGIQACIDFGNNKEDDPREIWKKCRAEYKLQKSIPADVLARYEKISGELGKTCVTAATKFCDKLTKDLAVSKNEYACLYSKVTAQDRQYMDGFDDTACSILVRTGGKKEPAEKPAQETRPKVAPKKTVN
ncbi:MAG TPA: hypothetical protein VM432_02810 [Bdellovibrionales bacterium]|nr:hypothetical protein [Bdellovibrionales bacterium]